MLINAIYRVRQKVSNFLLFLPISLKRLKILTQIYVFIQRFNLHLHARQNSIDFNKRHIAQFLP